MLKIFIVAFFFMIIQTILTYFQTKRIQNKMMEVRRSGDFGIGQTRGRIRPGNILVMAVGPNDQIVDIQVMRGMTFFAKFKPYPLLLGKTIGEIEETLKNNKINGDVQKSVDMALHQVAAQRRKRGEKELESLTD